MKVLNQNEALDYIGGAKLTAGIVALIGAISAFFLGVINGYTNPKACTK